MGNDGNTQDNKKKKKIIAVIVAAVLLIAAIIGLFIYNSAITAVMMRIQRLVGTVNLYNEEGNEQSLREKMRLGAGQTVTTAGESLIMVSLDDTKLMTMEETSKAEIKTRGKKLLFNLLEGNLFFNVTEKLSENESFDISTSTMVCGIRGTSAYVGRDSTSHEILMVTDGLVHVVATNPITKETTEVDVPAGQMITIYLDEEAEGDKTISIKMQSFKEEDLPAMALDTMRKNKALMDRVAKATGFSVKKLATLADLSSTKGVSMYGSAADEFRSEGVDDAIPFMGRPSHAMVDVANGALKVSGDDLPLEVAIITGAYDAANSGIKAGFTKDGVYDVTVAAGRSACLAVERAKSAGMTPVKLIATANSVNGATLRSIEKMTNAGLSSGEIAHVVDTIGTVYQENIDLAATTGATSNVEAALAYSEDHVDRVVASEMEKSSDGDTTSDALLAKDGGARSSAQAGDTDIKEGEDSVAEGQSTDINAGNTAGADNTAAGGNSGPNTASAGVHTRSSDYAPTNDPTKPGFALATDAATQAELKNAHNVIAYTDPATRVVALSDGTLFDPVYYAAANPEVAAAFGTSTEALLAHYLRQRRSQGMSATAPQPSTTTVVASQSTSSNESHDSNDNGGNDSGNASTPASSGSGSGGNGSGGNGSGGSGGGNTPAYGNLYTGTYANSIVGDGSSGYPYNVTIGSASGTFTYDANADIKKKLTITSSTGVQANDYGNITVSNLSGGTSAATGVNWTNVDWDASATGVKWQPVDGQNSSVEKSDNGTYVYTDNGGNVWVTNTADIHQVSSTSNTFAWTFQDPADPSKTKTITATPSGQ